MSQYKIFTMKDEKKIALQFFLTIIISIFPVKLYSFNRKYRMRQKYIILLVRYWTKLFLYEDTIIAF